MCDLDMETELIVDYLRSAPESLSDTLTEIYSDWCRNHPASFSHSDPPLPPLPQIPADISEYALKFNEIIDKLGPAFRQMLPVLLTGDYGMQLLWCLHEIRRGASQRALYDFLPILTPLERVRRGGLNVYKRYSWTLHVLIVSKMLWESIPTGTLPATIFWPESTINSMSLLRAEYERLNEPEIRLLRLACIIHDIGVRDGVEDHPEKGIRYVQSGIVPLGGELGVSSLLEGILSPSECLIALRALVGEHTLASRVNGESGPKLIRERLDKWLTQAPARSQLRRFLEDSFPRLLAIFLSCDIVGVADELLTAPTIRRTIRSIECLSNLISKTELEPPTLEEGAERLGILIGIEDIDDVITSLRAILGSEERIEQILSTIATADLLDYAMGVLKPIDHPQAAVAILARLAYLWRSLSTTQPMTVRFSPHCNISCIRSWGEALINYSYDLPKQLEQIDPKSFGVNIKIKETTSAFQLEISTLNEQA